MVRKEGMQVNGNSLLMTATSKRFGPGRFASLVARGTAKPPIQKVKYSSSDASRISEMTASVVEEALPALVKEVKAEDFDIESDIFEMSMTSEKSSYFGKESPLLGNEKTITPQPRAYHLPPKKDGKPMEKKEVNIHKGITFKAPSPMSLDRVQVQMGQERTAPPSAEWKMEDAERKKIEDQQREKKEIRQITRDAAKQFKDDMRNECGEGFEAQLEEAEFEAAPTKKSLMKKFIQKLRPKKPMTENRAREMAREAISKAKLVKSDPNGKPPLVPGQLQVIPVEEITMADREETVSDLDSVAKNYFPMKEITMNGEDSRDDSSVSTLGTHHLLERMGPGALTSRLFQRENRDAVPPDELLAMGRQQMFHPKGNQALIDRIDSGNMTEDVHQHAKNGRQGSSALGLLAAAMCMVPGMGNNLNGVAQSPTNEDKDNDETINAALAYIRKGMEDDTDYAGMTLKKTLSPIEEDEAVSPRRSGIPELEGYDAENPMYSRPPPKDKEVKSEVLREGSDVIDLTNLASPISPTTEDGIKGGAFAFDDIMDVAASKLTRNNDDDRYTVEGDTSPRKAVTPKASGGQSSTHKSQVGVEGRIKHCHGSDGHALAGQISPQSSFEVYEHPEGDVVMWSENPATEKKIPAPKDFNGNFSDGLFDLLSTDESVSRGRKKVPFLSVNQATNTSLDETQDSMDEIDEANACMFDLTLGACGKNRDPTTYIQDGLRKMSARVTGNYGLTAGTMSDDFSDEGKINPNLGVMCGAVPLYFMYQAQNKDKDTGKQNGSENLKMKTVDYIKIPDDLAARAASGTAGLPKAEGEKDSRVSLPKEATPAILNPTNVLLDREDAFWDTLSTIASTKDKSAGSSVKPGSAADAVPGPIPIEITMKSKGAASSSSFENEPQVMKAIGNLSSLIVEDSKSTESLSKQLAAAATEPRPQKLTEKTASEKHQNPSTSTKKEPMPKEEEVSLDNSELILAVTRSEGNDEQKNAMPSDEALSPRNSNGWQVRGMSKPFRISQETLLQASSALRSYLPKSPQSADPTNPGYSTLQVHSKREGGFTSPTKPDPKPEPLSGSINNAFANPWKSSSTRSVSWGVEEIYEATSPTSNSGIEAPERPRDDATLSVAELSASTASQAASQRNVPSPMSYSTQSASQLSAKDEQELISRTLLLSKQILSSMAPHELGGADNDFVRSLMSFGTEEGKVSVMGSEYKTKGPVPASYDQRSANGAAPSSYSAVSDQRNANAAVQSSYSASSNQFNKNRNANTTSNAPSTSGSFQGRPRTPASIRPLGPDPASLGEGMQSPASNDPPQGFDSIQPAPSGRSDDSPIDVESLFNQYDNVADHLIGENAKLQDEALNGTNDENQTLSLTSPKSAASPVTMSRLDQLRAHRAQAMAKLHGSADRQFGSRVSVDANQRKNRVSAYSQRSPVSPSVYESAPSVREAPAEDLDSASTRSASSSTPSMKARELRRQLDEAIQASRNIKETQEQLGSELEQFKSRFYRKSDALDDQVVRAVGGL